MPRAGLSPDAVVDAAVAVVDAEGPGALTLAAVAGRAGVATPSLYKHVRNLAELRHLVTARVQEELAERLGEAALGRSGDDAIRALMYAYRSYVVEHPGRYGAMEQAAQPEGDGPAAERLLNILYGALRGYDLPGPHAVHAVRCLRSAVHGFAVLEAAGGYGLPADLEASYELLITMVTGGLPRKGHAA
ncbi:WHG domain-containing protein [Actinomadura darangshiensis]|uniref:WHG domain-containing protein n=1 Tax=Actinomadura darangshiensis TaxID=705336 RepID=A0A4R4ZSL7_9ACTN|nr:TetR-like C-terminal domain-containing protein [Actinomadura darangshiensis]TDD61246.1 WHG domain-containing protein [Actinomadura darangshiensis]